MSVGEDFVGMMSAAFGKPVVLFDGKDGEVDGLLFVLDKPEDSGKPSDSEKTEEDKKEG